MTTKQAWGGFWLLALIWGSSFLFIRIGVEQLPPFQLVFIRTAIAAVGLTGVVYLRGAFYYHAWSEVWLGQWISLDSVLTSILVSAAPISNVGSMVVARFASTPICVLR